MADQARKSLFFGCASAPDDFCKHLQLTLRQGVSLVASAAVVYTAKAVAPRQAGERSEQQLWDFLFLLPLSI